MPDPRSAMKEYRFLEQKRVALGLTLDEEYRLAELRDLVGPELERLRRPGPGFDVNAAAARLRASLEGAVPGRRMAAPLAPSDSEDDADALLDAALGHANPAPLAPEASAGLSWAADVPDPTASYAVPEPRWELPGEPSDPGVQFTPGEQAWDPNTAHVDPGATPVDPYATYAAGEQAWDPNAYVDPAAGPVDPYATYPAGAQGWDPNAYVDPAAAPVDPDAAYAEGEQGLDPDAYVDPGAAPVDPASFTQGDQAWDPNAYVDPAVAPVDPDAAYADGEQGLDPDAYVDPGAPPVDPASFTQGDQVWDPNAYVDPAAPVDPDATYPAGEQAWDTDAYPAPPAAAESGLEPLALEDDVELLDGSARGRAWAARDASPAGVASARLAELSLEDDPASEPTAPPAPGDAAGLPPEGWDTQASPPPAPLELALGEYDDPATAPPADGSPLPVDLAAEPTPELAAAGPALDLGEYDALAPAPPAADAGPEPFDLLEDSAATGSAPGNAPVLGEYDDTSGFEAPAGAFALGVGPDAPVEGGAHAAHGTDHDALAADADAEVSFGALFDEGDLSGDATAPVADAAEAAPGARDDAEAEGAFRQGFQLESGGSFEAAADAAVPEWATGGEPPGWDAGAPESARLRAPARSRGRARHAGRRSAARPRAAGRPRGRARLAGRRSAARLRAAGRPRGRASRPATIRCSPSSPRPPSRTSSPRRATIRCSPSSPRPLPRTSSLRRATIRCSPSSPRPPPRTSSPRRATIRCSPSSPGPPPRTSSPRRATIRCSRSSRRPPPRTSSPRRATIRCSP